MVTVPPVLKVAGVGPVTVFAGAVVLAAAAGVRVNVAVSPQFYGWLSGLSGKVCILSPSEIALDYQKYLQNILDSYKNNC